MYDFTYVENVAHAHVCAERALASEGTVAEKASGQVAFYRYCNIIARYRSHLTRDCLYFYSKCLCSMSNH